MKLPIGIAPASVEEFRARAQDELQACRDALEDILAASEPRTPANTLRPFDRLQALLGGLSRGLGLARNVHPSAEVRDAAEECEREVRSFAVDLSLDRRVYDAIESCDTSGLDTTGQRCVERILRDFHRSGVDRDEATRARVKAISQELVGLSQTFARNIAGDTRSISLDSVDELDGLPDDYVRAHQPGEDGKIRITTDSPDYVPFMTYCRSEPRRRELYVEYRLRAWPANVEVLESIFRLRHELATLLGYAHWADYVTEEKMVGKAAAVEEFITRVADAAEHKCCVEYAELLERKRRDVPDATEVHDWERGYWVELLRLERFHVDSRELRPYFPYESARDGILDIAADLFGIEFEPVGDAPRWHPDVEVLDVREDGRVVARIYLDMHPREGKFKHAALFPIVQGTAGGDVPQAALVCNLPSPRASEGPALLEHSDVVTLFHEFGHLLHHMFARDQEWVEFSGIASEWDFVEVPSQLFEEWAWDPGVLQRFAHHHRSGEPIPVDLVERMRHAERFAKGIATRQQMYYAALSLRCHDRPPETVDLESLQEELQNAYTPFRYVDGTHFIASFGHLDGYSALYYTYMWSLVIEKDIADVFRAVGWMDRKTARRYREAILAPGGERDAVDLVRGFLGRDYGFDAFTRWLEEVPEVAAS